MVFHIKYEVVALEQLNRKANKEIQENKEAIHILKAEKSHLSDPKRLQALAKNYLDLQPIKAQQIVEISQLPTLKTEKDVPVDTISDKSENKSRSDTKSLKKKIDPIDALLNKIDKKEGL